MSSSYEPSSDPNHFSPDTPSGDWTQYVCTACGLRKRVSIAPSEAEPSIYRICKRCESRQRLRADGGSGKLPMIDLTKNPDVSPAAVLGGLRAGRLVRPPVTDDGEYVHLVADDAVCPRCEEEPLISLDSFGEGAPFFSLLANQKIQRGVTYCAPHHSEVTNE